MKRKISRKENIFLHVGYVENDKLFSMFKQFSEEWNKDFNNRIEKEMKAQQQTMREAITYVVG